MKCAVVVLVLLSLQMVSCGVRYRRACSEEDLYSKMGACTAPIEGMNPKKTHDQHCQDFLGVIDCYERELSACPNSSLEDELRVFQADMMSQFEEECLPSLPPPA